MQTLATTVTSAAGSCGAAFEAYDLVDAGGNAPAGGALLSRMLVCDGTQSAYQLQVGTGQAFRAQISDLAPGGSVTDLSGSTAAVYKVLRPQFYLAVTPQDVSFTAAAVVNAATFAPGISPGGLISIFGVGLAGTGAATKVDMDGTAMALLLATPFQINAQVPPGLAPGLHTIHVQSAFGSAQQQITVAAVSPGIFIGCI